MNPKIKETIDLMSYIDMLRLHRFAPMCSRYFIGVNGTYFAKVMAEKKSKLADGEAVRISKEVGWDE